MSANSVFSGFTGYRSESTSTMPPASTRFTNAAMMSSFVALALTA